MAKIQDLLQENHIALLLELANLSCHKGLPTAARTIADGILALKPGFPPALISLAYSHVVVDDFDHALEILEPLLKDNPEDSDARIIQGMALLLAQRQAEAKEAFSHIPEDAPQKILATELLKAL